MQSLFLSDRDAFLRYHDFPGDRPVRVFLHSLGCAASVEYPRIAIDPALAKSRSILVDFLGFGSSDRPERFDYTLESHAETVVRLLDHLEIDTVDLIGHSMGGSIGIVLAAGYPGRVSRLVVAEGNLDAGTGEFSGPISRLSEKEFVSRRHTVYTRAFRREGIAGDKGMASFAATFAAAAPFAIHRSAVSLTKGTEPELRDLFLSLPIPKTFLFGERSLPDPDVEFLSGHGVNVAVVADAGHHMMIDNPDGFAAVVASALKK